MQFGNGILVLSDKNVFDLLSPAEVIEICEKTWSEYTFGKVINPSKIILDLGEKGKWPGLLGSIHLMPSYVHWLSVAGFKYVGVFPNNKILGRSSISAIVILISPHSGELKAIIEGSILTSLRTAAQTAIGIKYLARGNPKTVSIYGAGSQARYHIYVLAHIYPSLSFKIYNRSIDTLERTLHVLKRKFKVEANIEVVRDPEKCAMDADVIVTVTSARDPFLRPEWVRKGQLIVSLGSYQEIYDDVIKMADKIVVDHREQAFHRGCLAKLAERGEITDKNIYATIGEIIAGYKTGRESDDELILFVPTGTGMLDVATAELAYRKAIGAGIGNHITLQQDIDIH